MPATYVIVTMHITDPDRYKAYMAEAPAAVKAAGGEYVVRGGRHEVLEGTWKPHRVAMLKFPSYEQARAFYDSELYQAARRHRLGATDYFDMVMVEGVDPSV
jgi:uncharacterized protein (DUF1330 family)